MSENNNEQTKAQQEQTNQEQEQPFIFTGLLSFLNDGIPIWFEVVSGILCLILLCFGIGVTKYYFTLGLPFIILVLLFSLTWFYFLYKYQQFNPQAKKQQKPKLE